MADVNVDLKKLKVPELKQALKEKGLPTSGTKAELIKRLGEALGTTVDTLNEGLEDSLQGIDDILNDDSSPVAAKAAPASPVKPAAKETQQPTQTPDTVSSNGASPKTESTNNKSVTDSAIAGKPAVVAKLSDAERLKMRADKFGATSTEAKKELRAQRFGVASSTTDAPKSTVSDAPKSTVSDAPKSTDDEIERLKKRADRFGAVVSTSLSKVDEEERKRKRAERFGTETNSTTAVKKVAVTGGVTDLDNEAKKRKRAERFGAAT